MRIKTNFVLLTYPKDGVTKEDVKEHIEKCCIQNYIVGQSDDSINCMVYRKHMFDLVSLRLFEINGITPNGRSIKQSEIRSVTTHLNQDMNKICKGAEAFDKPHRKRVGPKHRTETTSEELKRLTLELEELQKQYQEQTIITIRHILRTNDQDLVLYEQTFSI